MLRRLSLHALALCGMMLLIGCTSSSQPTEEELIPGIPSPFAVGGKCKSDSECVLTDTLYDPCGSVYAIHHNTSQGTIDGYNELQMAVTAGQQYDCDLPPNIEDYRAICQQHVCTVIQK